MNNDSKEKWNEIKDDLIDYAGSSKPPKREFDNITYRGKKYHIEVMTLEERQKRLENPQMLHGSSLTLLGSR